MKKWIRLFGAFLFFFCLTPLSWSAGQITLKEAIEETLHNNPSVRAYEERVARANLNIKIAKTYYWGELMGNAGVYRSEDRLMVSPMTPHQMREGIEFEKTRFGYGVACKLPIYLGGKIPLSVDISRLSEASAGLALKRLQSVIRHRVTELYHNILSLEGEEKAVDENIRALKVLLKHTELAIRHGKKPPIDRYKIDYSLKRWQAIKDKIVNQRVSMIVALQTLMGRGVVDSNMSLTPVEIPKKLRPLQQDIQKLYTLALERRSDLQAAMKKVEIAKKKVGLAHAERMPSIFAVGSFQTYDAPHVSFEEEWDASLQLRIPLFDAGRRKMKVEAAKVGVLEERMHVFELQQAIIKEVGDAIAKVRTTESLVESYESRVQLEKEVDRVETLKYEKGAGDIDDMLRAKAELAYSKSKWVESMFQWLNARSYLSLVIEEDVK